MPMKVEIAIEGLKPIIAEIDKTESETCRIFMASLPLTSIVNRWGDEIYFYVKFKAPLERDARSEMAIGELAYWPEGPALAIFFGPTPASKGKKPIAASDCNVLGKTISSPTELRKARDGSKISIRIAGENTKSNSTG